MNTQILSAALASFTPGETADYISTRAVQLNKYFLARFLPPVISTDAEIREGSVRVLSGLAGVTAPDSPYAKVGGMRIQQLEGHTIKLTAEHTFTERDQRILASRAMTAILNNGQAGGVAVAQQYISRMFEDGIMMSLDNGQEMLRAVALATGQIKGTFGGIDVEVDYGIPTQFKPAKRTGNNGYGGSASKFWDDVDGARVGLLGGEPEWITDPKTYNAIVSNPVNAVIVLDRVIVNDWLMRVTLGKQATNPIGTGTQTGLKDLDARRQVTVWVYSGYAENPLTDDRIQFWPEGHLTAVLPGSGTVDIIDGQVVSGALGVTHIGPTAELGMAPGRYGKIYRPEDAEYQVQLKGAENVLPVIRDVRRAMFYSTSL